MFWTAYRWWLSFASPVAAVLFQIRRNGWGDIMNVQDVLINAVGGATVAFLGSVVISFIRAPKLLDDERIAETESLRKLLETRRVSGPEQIQRDLVREMLMDFSEQEKKVLEHIRQHGETLPDDIVGRFGLDAVDRAGREGRKRGLLSAGRDNSVCIRPEFAEALRFYFHGE